MLTCSCLLFFVNSCLLYMYGTWRVFFKRHFQDFYNYLLFCFSYLFIYLKSAQKIHKNSYLQNQLHLCLLCEPRRGSPPQIFLLNTLCDTCHAIKYYSYRQSAKLWEGNVLCRVCLLFCLSTEGFSM